MTAGETVTFDVKGDRMKIVEFSGVDGTGKTTAMGWFCDELERLGQRVLRTREVGNPHVHACAELRRLILDPEQEIDGRAFELCCAAMRVQNKVFYDSVRDRYDYVVSDRGWLCHLAYSRANACEVFTEQLYLDLIAKETDLPDRVYLFTVDPEEAVRRRENRDKAVDAIEAKGEAFQARVAEAYVHYAALYPEIVRYVAAGVSKDQMEARMRLAAQHTACEDG